MRASSLSPLRARRISAGEGREGMPDSAAEAIGDEGGGRCGRGTASSPAEPG
jgi:hypothetical protein